MKVFQSLLVLMLLSTHLLAQQYDSRIAPTRTPLENVEMAVMPALDNDALLQEELQRRGPGIAPRYAQVIDVDITPETHGTWETLSDGNAVWRLRIQSKDAKSINLGFTKFFMPQGGTLILYSTNLKKVMGPFTPADNEEHEQLWTPVFDGEELVIEVQLPESRKNELELELTSVNHDFIGFSTVVSGSCNLDVICGTGDGWEIVEQYRDIIQSVAVIGTGGGTFCTGFLVNNTRNDCTPYFMTANHCLSQGEAPSLVVYWNYINSDCRQPNTSASGNFGNGVLTDFNTGSIHRSHYAPSDFFLVELDDEVSETANAFFAGWSAEQDFSTVDTLIGIHHPNTEEKRISFDFDTPQRTFYFDATVDANADHVRVPDWDVGTTEGGSSGSPLFDDNKRVIGQLHGGGAACGNNDSDWYGSITTSWEGGGSPQTRLKDWLDPDNTGILAIDGRDQLLCNFFVLATNNNITLCAPDSAIYTINVSESFSEEVMLTIDNLPAGANAEFSANPVMPGDMLTLTVSNTEAAAAGVYTMTLNASAGTDMASSDIMLTIFSGVPDAITLNMPVNGATGQTLSPSFSWNTMGAGVTYQFQLSTDVDFNDIIFDESSISNTNIFASMLDPQTTYFWRVIGSNICGEGGVSEVFSLETAAISCEQSSAEDLPIEIVSDAVNSIESRLDVNLPGFISEISINNLEILHTWVGDLRVTLTSPDATIITLFDQPGVPGSNFGCGEDNIAINVFDNAANSAADLEDSCGTDPAISGDFQPVDPLSVLIGESATGTWTLTVYDEFDQDGGQLINWDLDLCIAIPQEAALYASASEHTFCENETISFEMLSGTGFDNEIMLSASGLPNEATIEFSPNPVMPGSTTVVSVSGITTSGTYMLVVTGDDGVDTAELPITLNTLGTPAAATMTSPANGATGQMMGLTLTWESVAAASSYTVTVASDVDFNDIITSNTQASTTFNLTGLDFGSTYYWTVESTGECGTSGDGQVFSFTTVPDVNVTVDEPVQEVCLSNVAEFGYKLLILRDMTSNELKYEILACQQSWTLCA